MGRTNGRQASAEEIADELGMEARKVQWMMKASWQPLSLEQPVGEGSAVTAVFAHAGAKTTPRLRCCADRGPFEACCRCRPCHQGAIVSARRGVSHSDDGGRAGRRTGSDGFAL